MKKLAASLVAVFVASSFVATSARAAHPQNHTTKKGEMIISAERLFGFNYFSAESSPQGGAKQTTSGSMVNFLWGGNDSGAGIPNIYATPRAAFDYAIIDGFTVGGTFGVLGTGSKTEANGQSQTGPSTTTVAVSTRLGYCFAFGKHGLWLRGGTTYFSASTEQTPQGGGATVKSSLTGLALSTDALFVFAANDTVSFTAGFSTDYGVSGSVEQGGTKTDFKLLNFGIPLGMLVHF